MIMNFRSSINILSLYELVREHWLNMQLKCSTGVGISSAAFSDILSKDWTFLDLDWWDFIIITPGILTDILLFYEHVRQ